EDKNKPEEQKLVKLLQGTAREQNWNIQHAYRFAQAFQRLLRLIRDQIKGDTDEALRNEEARYGNSTDGVWLEEREEYYKALTESLYLQRRAGLIETLFTWWTDVLRSGNGVDCRELPNARKETGALAKRFPTTEVLRKLQRLEELRDQLGRNIQEALAIEVACLSRTEANAKKTADQINETQPNAARSYAVDVASHATVQKLGTQILEDFGKIDILVNNAGVTRDGLSMRMSMEDWDTVINTN